MARHNRKKNRGNHNNTARPSNRNGNDYSGTGGTRTGYIKCQNCGRPGHVAADCRLDEAVGTAQQNNRQIQREYCKFCKSQADHKTSDCDKRKSWVDRLQYEIARAYEAAHRCMWCREGSHPASACQKIIIDPQYRKTRLQAFDGQTLAILFKWEELEAKGADHNETRQEVFGPGPRPSPAYCVECDEFEHGSDSWRCPNVYKPRLPVPENPNGQRKTSTPERGQHCRCVQEPPNPVEEDKESIHSSNKRFPPEFQDARAINSLLAGIKNRRRNPLDQHALVWDHPDVDPTWTYNPNLASNPTKPWLGQHNFNEPGNCAPFYPPVIMHLSHDDIASIDNPASYAHRTREGFIAYCHHCGMDALCGDTDGDVIMTGIGNSPATALGGGLGKLYFRNPNSNPFSRRMEDRRYISQCQCIPGPKNHGPEHTQQLIWLSRFDDMSK